MPIARSRPSSRVRSNTDRARVLMMPSRAMSTASSSITVTKVSSESMNPLALFSNSSWFITWASGCPASLGDRAVDCVDPAAGRHGDERGGEQLRARERRLLVDAEDEVVREPSFAVVDGDHLEGVLAGGRELGVHHVAELPAVRLGRGAGDHDAVAGEVRDRALRDLELQDLLGRCGVHCREARGRTLEPRLAETGGRHDVDAGDLPNRLDRVGAEARSLRAVDVVMKRSASI